MLNEESLNTTESPGIKGLLSYDCLESRIHVLESRVRGPLRIGPGGGREVLELRDDERAQLHEPEGVALWRSAGWGQEAETRNNRTKQRKTEKKKGKRKQQNEKKELLRHEGEDGSGPQLHAQSS